MVARGISGAAVLSELEEVIDRSEERLFRSNKEEARCEQECKELMAGRDQLFAALAREYLPELDAELVRRSMKEAEDEVRALIVEREAELRQSRERLAAAGGQRKAVQKRLHELGSRLSEIAEQRDALEESAKQRLDENPEYVRLRKEVDQSAARLMQDEQRLAEIKQERKEKLPDYFEEPLFTYLVSREYGRKKYRSTGLIRMLDDWVAKLVEYRRHREAFDFLRSTGELVEAEVERRKAELEKLLAEIKLLEEGVFSKIGLSECLERGRSLAAERKQAIDELEQSDKALLVLQQQIKDLETTEGPHYRTAIELISGMLESEQLLGLRRRAKEHPGERDDQLVQQISEAEEQIAAANKAWEEAKSAQTAAKQALAGLKSLHSRFLRNDYDAARSMFTSGFQGQALFEEVANSELSEEEAWTRLGNAQHMVNRKEDPSMHGRLQRDIANTIVDVLESTGSTSTFGGGRRSGSGGGGRRGGGRGWASGGGTIFGSGGGGGGSFSSGEGF